MRVGGNSLCVLFVQSLSVSASVQVCPKLYMLIGVVHHLKETAACKQQLPAEVCLHCISVFEQSNSPDCLVISQMHVPVLSLRLLDSKEAFLMHLQRPFCFCSNKNMNNTFEKSRFDCSHECSDGLWPRVNFV